MSLTSLKQLQTERENRVNNIDEKVYTNLLTHIINDCSEVIEDTSPNLYGYLRSFLKNNKVDSMGNEVSIASQIKTLAYADSSLGVCGEAINAMYNDIFSSHKFAIGDDVYSYYTELREFYITEAGKTTSDSTTDL